MMDISTQVREAGRTAFMRHKGLTFACVDAAIDAAIEADRASRIDATKPTEPDKVVEPVPASVSILTRPEPHD